MKKMDWLFGALIALLGLLLIIMPKFWICAIVILLGLAAIAYGIYSLVVTRKLLDESKYKTSLLIKGITSIVIGVVAILFPMAFGNAIWSAVVYILIIYFVLAAAVGFYSVSLLKNSGIERKKYILENLALLGIAVVLLLISPNSLGKALVRIIGIIVMIVGVVFAILGVKASKEVIIVSSEVKDEEDSQ